MDSRELREQELKQASQQCFATLSHIVNTLKKPQIERQIVLRDAAMRPKPRPEQGPKAFHGIDMHCVKALPVVIPSVFPLAMPDALRLVAPLCQATLEVVFVCVHARTRCYRCVEQRLDRHVLDVFQPANTHVTPTLDPPENRRLLGVERPAPACALETPAPSTPPFFLTASGVPF
jgi:hypothetical protein